MLRQTTSVWHPHRHKMTRRSLSAASVIIGTLAFLWWWFPTAERQVRLACEALVDSASVPAGETDVARLARLAQISRRLAPDLVVEAGDSGARLEGRDLVIGLLSRHLGREPLTVTLDRLQVEVLPDGTDATARASVRVSRSSGTSEGTELHVVSLKWRRGDDDWLLVHAIDQAPLSAEP